MKTIDKYILTEFLRIFIFSMVILIVFYEMVLFFDNVGYFIKHKATFDEISRFQLFKAPTAVFHVTPICVLMSALLVIVSMSRYSEIVVIQSSGISLLRIAAPLLVAGAAISFISFLNSDYLVYIAESEAKRVYYDEIKEQPRKSLFSTDRFWYKGDDGSIWNIGHIDIKNEKLRDLSIFYFDKDRARITKRVSADSGALVNGKWVLTNYVERVFDENGNFEESRLKTRSFPEDIIPSEDLQKVKLHPEEMNLVQMRGYIKNLRAKGYDATRYTVDMYAKVGFPLISFVMPLIAIPMGLRSSRAGGAMIGVGVAIVIASLFWFMQSMGVALGHAGVLPPLLAAYGVHVLFGSLGLYMLISNRQ